jgi:hypothetical protein
MNGVNVTIVLISILMTTLLLLGTTATQIPNSPLNVSTDAKAYYIDQNETNI